MQARRAEELSRQIRALDADDKFEEFFIRLLDHFGVQVEDHGTRSYYPAARPFDHRCLSRRAEEGHDRDLRSRARAEPRGPRLRQRRSPLVRPRSICCSARKRATQPSAMWKSRGSEGMLLEIYAVVECVAPAGAARGPFSPRHAHSRGGGSRAADHTRDEALAAAGFEKGDIFRLLDRGVVKKKLLPAMLEKAQALATERMAGLVEAASTAMTIQLRDEIERLEDLRQINDHVRPEEIAAMQKHQVDLREAIAGGALRVDAVRLIFRVS